MSNHLDPKSTPLNIQAIKEIDNLDLPIIQKHHVRILAHCLQIIKTISPDNSPRSNDKNLLREWCDDQSKKFDDQRFSDLFYEQLQSTANKLDILSQTIDKNIEDLEIGDLVLLVEQDHKSLKIDPEEKI